MPVCALLEGAVEVAQDALPEGRPAACVVEVRNHHNRPPLGARPDNRWWHNPVPRACVVPLIHIGAKRGLARGVE